MSGLGLGQLLTEFNLPRLPGLRRRSADTTTSVARKAGGERRPYGAARRVRQRFSIRVASGVVAGLALQLLLLSGAL
jgi:hypothetical protein